MPLLQRDRRHLGTLLLAAFGLVGGVAALRPGAPLKPPAGVEPWRRPQAALDQGLRARLPFAGALARTTARLALRGPETAAVEGKDGQLFAEQGLLRAIGREVRPAAVDAYTDWLCGLNRRLVQRGTTFAFAVAPATAAIYPDRLPSSVGRPRTPSETDLILTHAAACGVVTVDVRPALVAAKTQPIYRKTDSRWTDRGALIAYDALVNAIGQGDWAITPERLPWRVASRPGDLRPDGPPEPVPVPDLSGLLPAQMQRSGVPGITGGGPDKAFLLDTGRPGPTVLVVGDRWSRDALSGYFAAFAGKVAWASDQGCRLDPAIFDALNPAIVILMPSDAGAQCRKP